MQVKMFRMQEQLFFRRSYRSDDDGETKVFHVLVQGLLEQFNSRLPFKPDRELFITAQELELC